MNADKLYDFLRLADPEDEIVVEIEGMEELVVYGVELDERDGRLILKACAFEDLGTAVAVTEDLGTDDDIPFDVDNKPPACALPERPSKTPPESKEA